MRRFFSTFTVTVLFAAALWVVVNLNGEFQVPLRVALVVDVPENLAPASPLPNELTATVKGTGWQVVQAMLSATPECRVTISEYDAQSPSVLIRGHALADAISVPAGLHVVAVSPDTLHVTLDARWERTVPVVPIVDVRCAGGFERVGVPRVEPESIRVSGAAAVLRTLSAWRTRTLMADGVSLPVRRDVPLSDSLASIVRTSTRSVTVALDVQETGEREFARVPIRLVNAPPSAHVRIEPRTARVVVRGGAESLAGMRAADIQATVDFLALPDADSVPIDIVPPPHTQLVASAPRTAQWFVHVTP